MKWKAGNLRDDINANVNAHLFFFGREIYRSRENLMAIFFAGFLQNCFGLVRYDDTLKFEAVHFVCLEKLLILKHLFKKAKGSVRKNRKERKKLI